MPYEVDETHDPSLESWLESANDPSADFPIQNLPLCVFAETSGEPRPGTIIGDLVLDLTELARRGLAELPHAFAQLSASERSSLRRRLVDLLRVDGDDALRRDPSRDACFHPLNEARLRRPAAFGDYTDFYASVHHATNVGSMFRPDNPLLPNYKWIPVAYHGRASSVDLSGMLVTRPEGQQAPAEEGGAPAFGPCKMLDYELEMGIVVAGENSLGRPVPMEDAEERILGLCLLNDWSARDLQKWEYQPLGPFLAKSFATTVGPFLVTMEALAPFRCPPLERPAGDPAPMPHLDSEHNRERGGIDISLEVHLRTEEMRDRAVPPVKLSTGNLKSMYWTPAQMIAHHTSNGCNLQPGDLLGTGTVSGPARESRGSLLELTWDGDPWSDPPVKAPGTQRTPIELPTGETRTFLADGDEVILKGYCERDGYRRIGFGECRGVVSPAKESARA